MNKQYKIVVVGTGYVGLVAGACFADWGHSVTCVDVNAQRIDDLNNGKIPIYEPSLDELVHKTVAAGKLVFTTDLTSSVANCDAAYIAVGTPPDKIDGDADLSFVYSAARDIFASINANGIVVTKSTVPVGTGDIIERIARSARPDTDIPVASNPEFLREGTAIHDFQEPDRVVFGTNDDHAKAILTGIFKPLADKNIHILSINRRGAELIKYAANAFLATKITFINEMADLCEQVGADVSDIALGMGLDSRISPHFLRAGPGYGGSCFPKDTLALLRTAQEYGVNLRLVEETVMSNSARKRRMALKVKDLLHGSVDGKKIAILGLTFKPDTDDMRDSPSIPMIRLLQRSGAIINAYDPEGMEQARKIFKDVEYFEDAYHCVEDADAVVFMTEWVNLKHLDLDRLAAIMKTPVMVDLRRIYSPEEAAKHGFTVETIGRSGSEPHPVEQFDPSYLVQEITMPRLDEANSDN